jgi:diadenosine tetraphosphate (Ap4A) HIT family hydrolase
MTEPCLGCAVARGEHPTPGGFAWRGEGWAVHAVAAPSPIAGWLVATSARHARAFYELDDGEAAALGRLCARVARAQREALGAEHVYAFAIGDALRHCHVHLVPRYAGTPARLRGRGAFDARPEDAIADEVLAGAVARVRAALARTAHPLA